MVHALVKWVEEDRLNISSAWIIEPDNLKNAELPVQGQCYLKRKNLANTFITIIIALSGN